MTPLPSPLLYGQTRGGKALENRRSKRRARDASGRTERLELRLEPRERETWVHAAAREGYFSLADWIRDRLNGAVKARVFLSSDRQTWNTPREVLEVLKPLGPIGLDPCSNATSIVRARVKWTVDDDGLARDWRGHGLVYVNPPYGDDLPIWIEKIESEAKRGVEIVGLVPARTDTRWFDRCAQTSLVSLWRGRLTYLGAQWPAPFPTAIPYWGRRRSIFRRALAPQSIAFLG